MSNIYAGFINRLRRRVPTDTPFSTRLVRKQLMRSPSASILRIAIVGILITVSIPPDISYPATRPYPRSILVQSMGPYLSSPSLLSQHHINKNPLPSREIFSQHLQRSQHLPTLRPSLGGLDGTFPFEILQRDILLIKFQRFGLGSFVKTD